MVLVASFGLFCVAPCGPIDWHQHPLRNDDNGDGDDSVDHYYKDCDKNDDGGNI